MRGKEYATAASQQEIRITPAHAGKSAEIPIYVILYKDHPRPCGEKFGIVGEDGCRVGSSPPMRGKEARPKRAGVQGGITPAHAGKSAAFPTAALSRWDHPRPCGEKCSHAIDAFCLTGSPPPMRGKAKRHLARREGHGITPAHAGKRR